MRMRGTLSAIEDEWHISGMPVWADPLFTFQRTWYPDDVPPSDNFNPTVAKALALIGGGLLGYYVWNRTRSAPYTGLAGAAGFIGSPMLLAVYDRVQGPRVALPGSSRDGSAEEGAPDGELVNTYTPTPGSEVNPTLVPGSPEPKAAATMTVARTPMYVAPRITAKVPYDPNALI